MTGIYRHVHNLSANIEEMTLRKTAIKLLENS